MALFGIGKKKNLVQQVLAGSWRSLSERDEILKQLKASGLSPVEAVPLIWHKDPACRQLGVDAFVARASAGAVHAMLAQMAQQPTAARSYAARLIPKVGPDVMERVIEGLLNDRSAEKKRQGWDLTLMVDGALRDKYVPRAAAEAPDAMRLTAVQKLVQVRNLSRHTELLLKLAKDRDVAISSTALEALGKVDDPRVVKQMIDSFSHGDASSRTMAAKYLERHAERHPQQMRKQLMELLGEGEDATRRMSVELLFKTGDHKEIILNILDYSRHLVGWLRDRILDTLRTMGDEVLQHAVDLLEHEDEDVRTAALVLAETFNDPRVVEPVCRLLGDEDWWLRITACDTLGRLGDERALPHLFKALKDEEARWAAIDALARIGSVAALKPLAGLLRDRRQEVRLEVVRALSNFDDKRLLPLLKNVKEKDPSSEVRTRAAEVLRDLAKRLGTKREDAEQGTMAISSQALTRPIDKLLSRIREEGASDLHVTVDNPPFARHGGVLERMEGLPPLDARQTQAAILSILTDRHKRILKDTGEVDFCHAIPEVGRYRVNVFVQRLGLCAAFRVIPNVPPTFADLRLPGRLTELIDYHQGIIVVSGPAASGKSTTLAAIINLINESKPDHIICLEDPIEFVHPPKVALVNQREIGSHSESFARSLRASLRQDPDVIMVGEMRDRETIRMALMAAETGHLVVATLHTTNAVQTIDRLVGSFPPEEQPQVRMSLSDSLKYVISQSLIPRKDGKGRVAVFEVLKGTLSVSNLIRDSKTFQIPSLMQIGRKVGMQTVDVALMELVDAGLISPESAWSKAQQPDNFAPMCKPSFLREVEGIE